MSVLRVILLVITLAVLALLYLPKKINGLTAASLGFFLQAGWICRLGFIVDNSLTIKRQGDSIFYSPVFFQGNLRRQATKEIFGFQVLFDSFLPAFPTKSRLFDATKRRDLCRDNTFIDTNYSGLRVSATARFD